MGRKTNTKARSRGIARKNQKESNLQTLERTPESEAREALRISEAEYRGLFENILEGVYRTLPDGQILAANPALVRMLGYDSEEDLCNSVKAQDLYIESTNRDYLTEELDATGVLLNAEFELKRKDGRIITVLENARAVMDDEGNILHYEGLLTDITKRKKAERALRESEERYRVMIDNAGQPITLFDTNGRIIVINNTGARNLGGTPEDFIGKSMYDILPDRADEFMERNRQVIESGKGQEFEDIIDLPTGKRWFLSNIQLIRDADGTVEGVQVISQEITELKRHEDMLLKSAEELKAQHKALQEKNIALSQVLEHIESQKRDDRNHIMANIEKALKPFLNKLQKTADAKYTRELKDIQTHLDTLLGKNSEDFRSRYSRLTSRESEICDMIRKGMSSKQISNELTLSLFTILKHRERIRKKLGLIHKEINLATCLRSHN
jgi:PAS domain S-box-containing protein